VRYLFVELEKTANKTRTTMGTTAVDVPCSSTMTSRTTINRKTLSIWTVLLPALVLAPTTTFAFVPSTSTPTSRFSPNQRQQQHYPTTTIEAARYVQFQWPSFALSASLSSIPDSLDLDTLLTPLLQESSKLVPPILQDFLAQYLDDTTVSAVPLLVLATVLLILLKPPKEQLVNALQLESILAGTFLQSSLQQDNLVCVYRASRDGWSAIDFHEAVDNQGSGLVVAQLAGSGKIMGGFNPAGWRSTDDYYSSSAAFLWTITNNKVLKIPSYPGGNAAIFDYATAGPCFGAADLMIGPPEAAIMGGFAGPDLEDMAVNAGNLRKGKSSTGYAYDSDPRWPARGSFRMSQVEVYCNDFSKSGGKPRR
jgi:hypothetical protein